MRKFLLQLLLANFTVRGIAAQDNITCEMLMTDILYQDIESFELMKDTDIEWNCIDEAGVLYELAGDWKRIFDEYPLHSGDIFTFQGVTYEPEEDAFHGLPKIMVYTDTQIDFVQDRRRLQSSFIRRNIGMQEVLAVRVTDASGNQPRLQAVDLSKRIFGQFETATESVASHLNSCSGEQLELIPSTRGDAIINGVLDIGIDVNVTDYNGDERKVLEKIVDAELTRLGYLGSGVPSYGFLMYVMPKEANLGAGVLGYAYIKGMKSVYKDIPTFQVNLHEFGHSMGLQHSGIEGSSSSWERTYGDTTCLMGYSATGDDYDYPQKCFNGPKSFHLGWYNTLTPGHEVLGIESDWRGKLVGHHDYFKPLFVPSDSRVIANIGSLYVMFNRAEAFTENAPEANTVVVTEVIHHNDGITPDFSLRKTNGVLSSGGTGTYATESGEIFTVVVCEIAIDETNQAALDYAEVIICRNNNEGSLVRSCGTELPTAAPTAQISIPQCPAELIYNEGETMPDENAPLIKITSQDTTSVNFQVVNTLGGLLTSTFTMYTTGVYGESVCLEEDNILSESISSEYTAVCRVKKPFTIVNIWAVDGTGDILSEGDEVVIPKCCHADVDDIPPSKPTALYTFKIPCVCGAVGSITE